MLYEVPDLRVKAPENIIPNDWRTRAVPLSLDPADQADMSECLDPTRSYLDVIDLEVAEAPGSVAEWAVALRFGNPRATVLVLLSG